MAKKRQHPSKDAQLENLYEEHYQLTLEVAAKARMISQLEAEISVKSNLLDGVEYQIQVIEENLELN